MTGDECQCVDHVSSGPAKFRKKPVVIEAFQLTADNVLDVFHWCGGVEWDSDPSEVKIHTLEGVMTASEGDYIIKGVKGEFYPVKPDIFLMTYEAMEDGR